MFDFLPAFDNILSPTIIIAVSSFYMGHFLTKQRENQSRLFQLKLESYSEYFQAMKKLMDELEGKKPNTPMSKQTEKHLQSIKHKIALYASEDFIYGLEDFEKKILNHADKEGSAVPIIILISNLMKLARKDIGFKDKRGKKDNIFPYNIVLKSGEREKIEDNITA